MSSTDYTPDLTRGLARSHAAEELHLLRTEWARLGGKLDQARLAAAAEVQEARVRLAELTAAVTRSERAYHATRHDFQVREAALRETCRANADPEVTRAIEVWRQRRIRLATAPAAEPGAASLRGAAVRALDEALEAADRLHEARREVGLAGALRELERAFDPVVRAAEVTLNGSVR